MDRGTFYRYVNEDEDFAKAVKDVENITFDFVESQLHKQIKDNNTASTIFYAKTKMKNRGYVERQEITGADSGEVTIKVIHAAS